jgi:AraC-like DNA-binding protein
MRLELGTVTPVAALFDYVRYFQQRKANVDAAPVIYPIAARPEQILEFYLEERYLVHSHEAGTRELTPRAVIVGPCTYRRVDLILQGRFDVFTIHFQPSGFHRLFGVSMPDLADRAYDARSILGFVVSEIEQKLAEAASFAQRIRVATDFLQRYVSHRTAPDAVGKVANRFLVERYPCIRDAAAITALSVRQFERRFCEQVGISPKLYARIVRFHAALDAKLAAADCRWTDIAYEFGYYDQMHMVRDFRQFSGESPAKFSTRLTAIPEPWV